MTHLPLQLTPDGALADARGEPLAPADAEALLRIVNAAWEHAMARGGSLPRHRATEEALYAAVEAARGEETNSAEAVTRCKPFCRCDHPAPKTPL